MNLSACMIVKNEAKMLEKTLPSLSQYADEIILVDTGSTDKTIEVAKKYGAKISSFTWINDFAAARNESLKLATGDWIIWVDADEYFNEANLKLLKKTLLETKAEALNVTLYESALATCETKNGYRRVKAFKNNCGFHFVRPINEQLVNKAGRVVKGEASNISLFHWGKDLGQEKMNEKRARYVKLYSQALEEDPSDAHLHFLLAMNLAEQNDYAQALYHYRKSYELAPDLEIARKALEKRSDLLLRVKKMKEAAVSAAKLMKIDPESVKARTVYASIFLVTGQVDLAITALTEALEIKKEGVTNCYQDVAMPNYLLGKAYEIKGEKELAKACFGRANKICPTLCGVN
ncbi:MAG: glycosyltransferase [Candidatus Margulisbacteria bacterium]|nr:glycosyltransferase [Candidatus Margulisiibacteriota bacterium]